MHNNYARMFVDLISRFSFAGGLTDWFMIADICLKIRTWNISRSVTRGNC